MQPAPHKDTRSLPQALSALGIGSALGAPTADEDAAYERSLRRAMELGVTHMDTAINYRCQLSERVIGRTLRAVAPIRDTILVTTKGGYLPLEAPPPSSKAEYRSYVQREYLDTGIIDAADLVAGGHCISPTFLRNQIERSRANLDIDCIDIYYLHNPEQQLETVSRDEFDIRMHAAFATLEECVRDGLIRSYGCATWDGLRVPVDAPKHLSIESLITTVNDVAGSAHHLAAVEIPINLGMMEAVRASTQMVNGHERTSLEAADEMGLTVIAVAPLLQGRLARDLPAAVRETFPEAATDAAAALSFVRMLPTVASVVVGMRDVKHVEENAALFA